MAINPDIRCSESLLLFLMAAPSNPPVVDVALVRIHQCLRNIRDCAGDLVLPFDSVGPRVIFNRHNFFFKNKV